MSRKKSLGAPAPGNDKFVRTLNEIDEVKKKIYLKERCLKAIGKRNSVTEQENEEVIHTLRLENQILREDLNQSLTKDQNLCVEIFSTRSKSSILALRRKSIEEISQNIDQTVCSTKRHLNKLKHLRATREQKLASLLEMEKHLEAKNMDDVLANKYNLENSLDKVKQKGITARKIRDIYLELLKKLQKDVRTYPRRLDALEKEKALLDQEDANIRQVHYNAMGEVEFAMREKKEVEEKVRNSKKEREQTLKNLKQVIKDQDPLFDEQRKASFQFQRKPKRLAVENRNDSDDVEMVSDEDTASPDKLDKYEDQANLLKSVTGIPFWNCKKMLWCLKNQIDISADLKQQSDEKFEKVRTLQDKRAQLMLEHDKIKYSDDRSFQKKLKEAKSKVAANKDLIEKTKKLIRKKNGLADKATVCSGLILNHLVRTTSNFRIALPMPRDDTDFESSLSSSKSSLFSRPDSLASNPARIANNFELLADGVVALNRDANKQLYEFSLTAEEVLEQPLICKQPDQVKLKNDNNTRIPGQLERKPSEDFDHYHANNEEYVSRDVIKRNASLAVRASRRRG